jgi:hypothetical protein
VTEVAENLAALRNFKTWLRGTFVVEKFTTPDDLGRKIAIALQKYSAKKPLHAAPPHFHGRDALVREGGGRTGSNGPRL